MNIYKNIVVNFNDNLIYSYEWNDADKIEHIKEIPIIKVGKKVFKKILLNHITLSDKEYDLINNKTIYSDYKSSSLLITDGYNCIVLDFYNKDDIAISSLCVSDDLDICDEYLNKKNYKLEFSIKDKREFNRIGREDKYIANFIRLELNEILKEDYFNKMLFYYNEVFDMDVDDIKIAYNELVDSLNNISYKHYDIYNMMLLAHKKNNQC